jgi:hypothetical protein
MPSHPERVRRNYDDVERDKPLAQQACKDCGCYGCLIPVPHKAMTWDDMVRSLPNSYSLRPAIPQADGDSTE